MEERPPMWREAANTRVLNKQSRTACKERSSRLRVVQGAVLQIGGCARC